MVMMVLVVTMVMMVMMAMIIGQLVEVQFLHQTADVVDIAARVLDSPLFIASIGLVVLCQSHCTAITTQHSARIPTVRNYKLMSRWLL